MKIIHKKAQISLLVLMAVLFIITGFLFAKPTTFAAYATGTGLFTQETETQNQMTQFSELSEEECVEFLVDNGIEIPLDFIVSPDLGNFVKWVIETVDVSPNYEFMYSYDVLHNFVESIRNLVVSNSMSQSTTQGQSIMAAAAYTLQDNTQYGSWNNNFPNYNCYIYSIGRTDVFKNPGYFSNKSFSISMSIYEMAKLVEADLVALGKGGVYVSNIRPNILSPNETLIAVRKTTNTGLFAVNDYHFMKYHPDGGFWTHKPGQTAILKYNHQPADKGWKQEAIINSSGTAQEGNLIYNSEIYYIVFNWSGLTIQGTTVTDFTPQSGFNGNVVIPDGVTAISANAFSGCTQLSQITIPASVTSIGASAFAHNANLTSIIIPSGVTDIGYSAFYGCTSITSFSIPDSIQSIGSKAFFGTGFWDALPNNSIVYAGNWVLGYKGTLNGTISLNPNTVYIADSAFSNSGLTSIAIPDSVKSIGVGAFEYCGNLTSVAFGSNSQLQSIEAYAFSASGLTSITIPYGVESIGHSAFYYCTNLELVTIPGSVTSIDSLAFESCYSLTDVIIPDSVTSMGWEVFYNTNITIYAEASSKPDGWHYDWNYYPGQPVVWGCELSQDRIYVVSFSNGIENCYNGISAPYREGYTFGGWSANAGGAIPVYVASNGAYHAIWMNTALMGSQYTLSFDKQGGTGTANPKTVAYGQTYGTLPTLTNPGYSLNGWWTAPNGGGTQITSDTLVLIEQAQMLYAKWTKISTRTENISDIHLELDGIYEYNGIYFDDVTPIIGTFYYDVFLSSLGLARSGIIDSEIELEVSQGQEYSFYLYNGDSWDLIGILSGGIKFSLEQFKSDVIIFKLLCIDSATQWGYLSGNATLTINF